MSPLQRTITLPVLLAASIFIAVFLSACADKIKTDLNVYRALDGSLVSSNAVIQRGSEQIYYSLEEKLSDPATGEKAKIWQPKAMLIKTLSADMMTYIEGLKTDLKKEAGLKTNEKIESFREADKNAVVRLFEKKEKGKELYERMKNYKNDILTIDLALAAEFSNTISLTTPAFDMGKEKLEFTKAFFDDIPTIAALAMLSKFQNGIRISENKMIYFCNSKMAIDIIIDGDFMYYTAFAVASSNYVKAGEDIEITAGVGALSKAAQPVIIINGKNIALDVDGASHYKFRASEKAGKHIVPVKVSFIDSDGKRQTITKNIEYTVAN